MRGSSPRLSPRICYFGFSAGDPFFISFPALGCCSPAPASCWQGLGFLPGAQCLKLVLHPYPIRSPRLPSTVARLDLQSGECCYFGFASGDPVFKFCLNISQNKSSHSGFCFSISFNFHSLRHFLSCFSLLTASSRFLCLS